MDARNRSIEDWLSKARTGEVLLPRFQRCEAWSSSVIEDFLTSVVRDLPTGSTLVLEVGEKPQFKSRTIGGSPKKEGRVHELLLDGQQRLTALWRSLTDNYPDKIYMVNFEDLKQPEVIGSTQWSKNGKKYPLWIEQPKKCWERQLIPLRLFDPNNKQEFEKWAEEAAQGNSHSQLEIMKIIMKERSELAKFNIPYLSLPSTTPKETAVEVFIKLNTTLVRLTSFDIVVAQLEEATGESLHDLVLSLTSSTPEITYYTEPSNLVLSASALLQDKLPSQRGYFSMDLKKEFNDNWPKILKGTRELVQFLEGESVFDKPRLPIESVLAPLVALWAEAPETPDERGNIRILLRKYLWRAFFTERYDRAVPTAILQDYRILKKVIVGEAKESEVPCFDEAKYPLPNKELLIYSRWPTYKDRLARAILLLTMRGGAEDIKDGTPLSRANIQERHYHHLFPVMWLRKNEPSAEPNCALNCILIGRKANIRISAKKPIKYLLETSEASSLGKDEIVRRLKTYFVDFDLLAQGDYSKFLEERAKACEPAIKSLCNGNAWSP